jgi:hypothetical protein
VHIVKYYSYNSFAFPNKKSYYNFLAIKHQSEVSLLSQWASNPILDIAARHLLFPPSLTRIILYFSFAGKTYLGKIPRNNTGLPSSNDSTVWVRFCL